MATVPKSFKQMCPSCEAMVPVRDPQLIGKKIDCPKCKYRFVVEDPAEAEGPEEDEAPAKKKKGDKVASRPGAKGGKAGAVKGKTSPKRGADDDDDEDDDRPSPQKKKGKSNLMLILGIGLAVVALGAIAFAVVSFMGDGTKKDGGGGGGGGGQQQPVAENKDQQPAPQPTVAEPNNPTNLLPNDTQVVISYPMDRLRGSSLRTIALENAGGFRPGLFEQQIGTSLAGVSRIITGMSAKQDWVFTVVRTKKPINEDAVKAGLKLEPHTTKIKGKYDVYLIRAELDGLGTLLLKANRDKETFAVYFHPDKHTLIAADLAPLTAFLEGDGKPTYLTTPPAPPVQQQPNTNQGGGNQGNSQGPSPQSPMPLNPGGGQQGGSSQGPSPQSPMPLNPGGGQQGGGNQAQQGGGNQQPQQPPQQPEQQGYVAESWLTIDPSLKAILDRIEKGEENKATKKKEPTCCFSVAFDHASPDVQAKFDLFGKDLLDLVVNVIPPMKNQTDLTDLLPGLKREIRCAGFAVLALDQTTFNFIVAAETKSGTVALAQDKSPHGRVEGAGRVPAFQADLLPGQRAVEPQRGHG